MSEPTPTAPRSAKRDRIRVRLQQFNSSRGQRVLGPAEIIGLAGSALVLVLVIGSYLYFLAPARSRLAERGSANTKWQTIYPGIAISVTVEGQYQNLRRFIQDIETNRQFVIINSVELERATETNTLPSAEGESTGGPRAALVSLRLEMATYFQRGTTEDTATSSGVH